MSHHKTNRDQILSQASAILGGKLKSPLGIVLGSPTEVSLLTASLPPGNIQCYQMDLFQADRLRQELAQQNLPAKVSTAPDLWDLPADFQTLLYPVAYAGERSLKIDMIEQAFQVLRPQGILVVLSPYDKDDFFPQVLKKVFGRVHSPMEGNNHLFWCQKTKERPRRRHEMTFQVNPGDGPSQRFVSRPGTFSYGRFDDGARALVETMHIEPGDRVLDLGCGCGTNGIFARLRSGPTGSVTFVDSNLRALVLTQLNTAGVGVDNCEMLASCTLEELPKNSFNVVLANPPYYAQLSIAQLFVEKSLAALKRKGHLYLVTKQPDQVGPMMADFFGPVEAVERRGYIILCARK